MPYEFLDDEVTADVTFRAWAGELDELFAVAADATANAMVEAVGTIRSLVTRRVSVEAEDLDLLLLRFLDEMIFCKDAEGMIMRAASVHIEALPNGKHHLEGELAGELIDPKRHELLGDVKAVTIAGLRVERTPTGWLTQVTLDV